MNNVVYYSYFDTLINIFLIERCGFDIRGETVGVIVNLSCNYHANVAFPDSLVGGFRVNKIGNSSVDYSTDIFKQGSNVSSANASMPHVFINKKSNTPVPIPDEFRAAFEVFNREDDSSLHA